MPRKNAAVSKSATPEITLGKPDSYYEEFIGQYKRLHESEKKTRAALYHLYALEHLCRYAESQGLDCRWIYTAFVKELSSKQSTVMSHYYIGGFISMLTDYGCDKTAAIEATAEWLGKASSPSRVRGYYNDFLSINRNWAPLNMSTILKPRALDLAAAVISSVSKPFPSNKYDQSAQTAFERLEADIVLNGHQNSECPVKIKLGKK